ncbi:MAG: CoA pyrophosphatase [Bacteroidales bacterium]|nr:CoA pyrophosphatase [Bacteroidales bacterium]
MQHKIKIALKQELPGWKSHIKLAPMERLESIRNQHIKTDSKQSAVLLILFKENDQIKILFILRSEYDGAHSGQISFPGGQKELADADLRATAVRETFEEIGLIFKTEELLGKLSDLYIPNSNFIVSPYVTYFDCNLAHLKPDPVEVQQIFKIALSDLMDEHSIKISEVLARGKQSLKAPCFCIDSLKIWGATAMILNELLDILRANTICVSTQKKMRTKN